MKFLGSYYKWIGCGITPNKIGQSNVEYMQHHNNKYEQFLRSCLTLFQPEPKDQLPTHH